MPRSDIRVQAEVGADLRRAVEAGVRDAAGVFLKAARLHARYRTGTLRRNIVVKKARNVPPDIIQYIVGVRTARSGGRRQPGDAFYWRFLEHGWRPRGPGARQKRSRRSLRRISEANSTEKKRFPFLEPAYQSAQGQALKAFYARLERGLDAR